jgi:uncharacterized protein YukJ
MIQQSKYNETDLHAKSKLIMYVHNKNYEGGIDNTLFIGWDYDKNEYFIRGKRLDNNKTDYVPYAFRCNSKNDVCDFINVIMDKQSEKTVVLYNYNNMYDVDEDIDISLTYEFFESYIDPNYEIVRKNDQYFSRKELIGFIRMLKYVYNWDNTNY